MSLEVRTITIDARALSRQWPWLVSKLLQETRRKLERSLVPKEFYESTGQHGNSKNVICNRITVGTDARQAWGKRVRALLSVGLSKCVVPRLACEFPKFVNYDYSKFIIYDY